MNLISSAVTRTHRFLFPTDEMARSFFPLTIRGTLLALFLAYLMIDPVAQQSDIIACIIASSLLALLVLAAAISWGYGFILRENLELRLVPPGDQAQEELLSQTPVLFALRSASVRILPFFVLTIRIEWRDFGITPVTHRITGYLRAQEPVLEMIRFPHRGRWQVAQIRCAYGDIFGFSSFSWEESENALPSLPIAPAVPAESVFPVISSAQRPGDDLADRLNRNGDPFDLKAYNPADGIKRIAWKIFARSGQLIARHPEAAFTPEGQVSLFVLADKYDDVLVGHAIAYTQMLERLDLQFACGVEKAPQNRIAHSSEDVKRLVIEHVSSLHRDMDHDIVESVQSFVSTVEQALAGGLSRLVIFVSSARLSRETNIERLVQLTTALEQRGIDPVLLVTQAGGRATQKIKRTGLSRYFFQQSPEDDATRDERDLLKTRSAAALRQYEIIERRVV